MPSLESSASRCWCCASRFALIWAWSRAQLSWTPLRASIWDTRSSSLARCARRSSSRRASSSHSRPRSAAASPSSCCCSPSETRGDRWRISSFSLRSAWVCASSSRCDSSRASCSRLRSRSRFLSSSSCSFSLSSRSRSAGSKPPCGSACGSWCWPSSSRIFSSRRSRSRSCCSTALCFSSSAWSCLHSSSLWAFSAWSFASISSFSARSCAMTSPLDCSFFFARVFTSLQREANSSVLMVSSKLNLDGLTQASSSVRLLPMSASFRSRVSFESRKGGKHLLLGFAKSAITRPKVVSDWLMPIPSLRRVPVAPVLFSLSLPARSTKCIFACLSTELVPSAISIRTCTVKTACDLDDTAFICVAPTARLFAPKSRSSRASAKLCMGHSVRPTTMGPSCGCSRICSSLPESRTLLRRSNIFSL
mmetsp:Transcript_119136/g.337736  ORF Transcript_119136/g.337736 Transcript_119136/m.337736 type:complete len:421 (-) Transcript_119136:591-1853(-)